MPLFSRASPPSGAGFPGPVHVAVAAAALAFAPPALAQGASFQGLGDLPGDPFNSGANGVSADGSVVVGYGTIVGNEARGFRWTQAGGMVNLGTFVPPTSTAGRASADGSVVVGSASSSGGLEAYRWTEAGGMTGLGGLPGGPPSFGTDASADGNIVVGWSWIGGTYEAFRWTEAGGMVGLGDLPGGGYSSGANGNSADGSVIVGFGNSDGGTEAFRWTEAGGMEGLGDLPGGSFNSSAFGISADGIVVVGQSLSGPRFEAFRWTSAGGMQGLGFLPGTTTSRARDASADGSVIVGSCETTTPQLAFVWTAPDGIRSLREMLVLAGVDMTGWTLTAAMGVSDDGRVVVGMGTNPQGQREAFRAVLAAPPVASPPGPPGASALTVHLPRPNPVAGHSTLAFEMPVAGHVRLSLSDILGREVAVLVDADRPAGAHAVALAAGRLPPGVYVARLTAPGGSVARPLLVAR